MLNTLEHLHDFEDFKIIWVDGVLQINPFFAILMIVLIGAGIFTWYQIHKAHQLKKKHNNMWKIFAQCSLILELVWAMGGLTLLIFTYPQQIVPILKML